MNVQLLRKSVCLAFALLAALACSAAPPVKVKLATLAPTGSSYHKSLLALREAWKKTSRGGVDLVVYADGKLGGEADTVNLMAVNSVQASVLMVKPEGTVIFRRHISARLAPLPPSRFFMLASPSVLLAPKT